MKSLIWKEWREHLKWAAVPSALLLAPMLLFGVPILMDSSFLSAKKFEPSRLLTDFRIARRALEEGHSGIYRYTSKKDLDQLFDQAERSLTTPMNAVEFYRILAPVVAAIKCGHTDVSLPQDLQKTATAKCLPLQIRVLEGKAYVFRDFSGASISLAGREIRSINGVPTAQIVKQ